MKQASNTADSQTNQTLTAEKVGTSDAAQLNQKETLASGFVSFMRRPSPQLPQPQKEEKAYTLRIDIKNAQPPIWRRVLVSSKITLDVLHRVIQEGFEWTDTHLHAFRVESVQHSNPVAPFLTNYDLSEGKEGIHESEVELNQVLSVAGESLHYDYDFGDGWSHRIKLEKVDSWVLGQQKAQILAGRGAGPLEDSGGIYGYQNLMERIAQSDLENYEKEWLEERCAEEFDPAFFDIDRVKENFDYLFKEPELPVRAEVLKLIDASEVSPDMKDLVRNAFRTIRELTIEEYEAATFRYRALLNVVGDGVKMTQAGYLPPKAVEKIASSCEMEQEWISTFNREDQTLPVLELRESAQRLGLVRKFKGQLVIPAKIQKIKDDPEQIFTHICSKLPLAQDDIGREIEFGFIAAIASEAETMKFYREREWKKVSTAVTVVEGVVETYGDPLMIRWVLHQWGESAPYLYQLSGGREKKPNPAVFARLLAVGNGK